MIKFTSTKQLKTAVKNYFNGQDTSDISNWDTSEITDMSIVFAGKKQISIEPIILNWDTSNVTNMRGMFEYCEQDFILNFRRHSGGGCHTAATDHSAVGNECLTALCDTSKVTDMSYMFNCAINFNQPLNFDTSNVSNMYNMFYRATNFNQPLNFNTKNVKNMSGMFSFAKHFNQPLQFRRHSGGCCHMVATDHSAVGNECLKEFSPTGENVRNALCDTSNVKDMAHMFSHATNFNQPLNFNTENVENMAYMFYNATNFNQPLHFDTYNVKYMACMFANATNFNQPLHFNTEFATHISYMFDGATNFNQPIYFQSMCIPYVKLSVFNKSPMEGQETKYVLTSGYYNKLFVMYALNHVNPELLYLLDEFEEFF